MTKPIVITEGPSDTEVFQWLFPDADVDWVTSGGRSSAISIAMSSLLERLVPLVIVLDSDTTDERSLADQRERLEWLFRRSSIGAPFRLVLAVPSLETIFVSSQDVREKLAGYPPTEMETELAKLQPKQWLARLGKGAMSDVIAALDESDRLELRNSPLGQSLQAAIAEISQPRVSN